MCLSRSLCVSLLIAAPVAAQGLLPSLEITPNVSLAPGARNGVFGFTVNGFPGRPLAVLLDANAGPVDLFGETLFLGLTPSLFTFGSGTLDVVGEGFGGVNVMDPALAGTVLYGQAFTLDPAAPNGLFRTSNGSSGAIHSTRLAIVDSFDDPAFDGFVGNFDSSVTHRVQGGAIRTRTARTVDLSQGVAFGQPIATPLNHFGSRAQFVFRPSELGATGEEEIVTAVRWRAFGGQVFQDGFASLTIEMAHSAVSPNFSVSPFSALPLFPASGLDPVFASNVAPGQSLQTVYQGSYGLQPSDLRVDGYVDYPAPQAPFAYNGQDSLLVEFKTGTSLIPGPGQNGQIVRLMVTSSPLPAARVVANGSPGATINPATVPSGIADNAMPDYQIEFVRVKTTATSPWRQGAPGADYQTPLVGSVTPPGTSIGIEYRGASDANGSNPTAWSTNVDIADGSEFVQYRISLTGDRATGAVPSVDTLVIPY